jgi:CheY-like chemotaxis protein/HPt (histidine-containing phosphotransfer) domain-containing protein
VRECVEAAIDVIGPLATERGLDLAYELDEGTFEMVVGDESRLRQILLNLLNNAVKFTEEGEVVLSVHPVAVDRPGSTGLRVTVRDTGIGIPPAKIDRLFESFSQADVSTSRKYGGTGLGLAISKRLAELMGGRMWAESAGIPGKGSAFHVEIVVGRSDVQPRRAPVTAGLRGKRLLVVDDNATNRRIVVRQATGWGMHAIEADSGATALETLGREAPFDVVVLDLMMPVMDGLELGREIRRRVGGALPLVLLSSVGLTEVRKDPRYEDAGLDGYLAKPLKPESLRATLTSALEIDDAEQRDGPATEGLDPELAEKYPLRILVAEDNPVNQKLALRLLEKLGYRADVAGNGIEAIQAIEMQTYDLVLMDVQMPEMDGLEATRRIVERWPGERPQIVAMTADAMQGDRERCLEAGMDEYLTKPIRTDELVGALREASIRTDELTSMGAQATGVGPAGAVDRAVLERLVESMGGDPEFVAELLETFSTDAPELLESIRGGIAAGDADTVRRAAHTLKSNAATFGATELASLGGELEAAAREGRLTGATELRERMERAYGSVSEELTAERARLVAP